MRTEQVDHLRRATRPGRGVRELLAVLSHAFQELHHVEAIKCVHTTLQRRVVAAGAGFECATLAKSSVMVQRACAARRRLCRADRQVILESEIVIIFACVRCIGMTSVMARLRG